MQYKNLKIIGTSHIAEQSIREVTTAFEERPDIVAIELDRKRLMALTTKTERKASIFSIRKIGVSGFLFALIGSFVQKRLGRYVNIDPGAEMLTAIKLAKKNNADLALIDQDIEITLRRFSKEFNWREKLRVVGDIFRAVFFRKREMKRLGITGLDLTKVPSKTLIKKLMKELGKRYPKIYMVLVEERNNVMSRNLIKIMHNNPDKKILAVVGAGHTEEILKQIKERFNKITFSYTFSAQ